MGRPGRAGSGGPWRRTRRCCCCWHNARDAGRIAPLLQSSSFHGRCAVIVTSRNRLNGLDTTLDVPVELLEPEAAVELLVRVAGRGSDEPSSGALAELARLCGYLALALRPVGALLADLDAGTPVRVMRSASRPLERLTEADLEAAAAFTVSYEALTADLQRTLRTCVWHPGPDFDAGSIGALSDSWELGGDSAVRTAQLLYVEGQYERAGVLYEQVRAAAARAGDERARGRAFTALGDLARSTGRHDEADALFGTALEILGGVADTAGEADALRGLGETARARGDQDTASAHFTAALARARQADDAAGQGYALTGLAHIARKRGELDAAGRLFAEAAESSGARTTGSVWPTPVRGLGHVRRALREFDAAERCFRDAMALHQRAGNRFGQAYALTALGGVTGEAGRFEEAAAHLDDALNLHRAANDRTVQARTHAEPAALAHVRGDDVAARRHESAAATLLGRSDGA
ncbi:tetratricopeptide repeat protein [Streptomyces anulatus]|uniref:tetratricopeptide repeat protein n=2 Tax=Streptomyces TaxID=1883 RepID=UPI00386EA44D